jgi:hypothetical protein
MTSSPAMARDPRGINVHAGAARVVDNMRNDGSLASAKVIRSLVRRLAAQRVVRMEEAS